MYRLSTCTFLLVLTVSSVCQANPVFRTVNDLKNMDLNVANDLSNQIDQVRQSSALSAEQKQSQIETLVQNALNKLKSGLEQEQSLLLMSVVGDYLKGSPSRLARKMSESNESTRFLVEEEFQHVRQALRNMENSSEKLETAILDDVRSFFNNHFRPDSTMKMTMTGSVHAIPEQTPTIEPKANHFDYFKQGVGLVGNQVQEKLLSAFQKTKNAKDNLVDFSRSKMDVLLNRKRSSVMAEASESSPNN